MNTIEILEANAEKQNKTQWLLFLTKEKFHVENEFKWLNFHINYLNRSLIGEGDLSLNNKIYKIDLVYSAFFLFRYDRIYIKDIEYNSDIHMYPDKSLCLYHPILDKPAFKHIELYRMIPWISEWIIFYEQWKKYGVWLGNEIKHFKKK